MKRRHFIKSVGVSIGGILLYSPNNLFGQEPNDTQIDFPSKVSALVNDQVVELIGKSGSWEWNNTFVKLIRGRSSLNVEIQAPGRQLSEVRLEWNVRSKPSSLFFNDSWERTYGNSSWHKQDQRELFPWFFMEYDGNTTYGYGVKTGANAFCAWELFEGKLSLIIDTRSGSGGVELDHRRLQAAEIVAFRSREGERHFAATRRFAKLMCEKPRLPKEPVYGINDWYFAYGKNSADLIMTHTNLMAPAAVGLKNRPFSVIDDGWFTISDNGNSADVVQPNSKFGDMQKLASQITNAGMRPGLWTRPLSAIASAPENLLLQNRSKRTYDPSIPENLERVSNILKTYRQWNYELVKFDYTSWDIFQKWGFQMLSDRKMSASSNWKMNDKSKTNAEVVLNLYKTIREAADDVYIISCNTLSHLSAGLFEINRIGDDTSGAEWQRTVKMGVNTLAARAFTDDIFYAADPDCAPVTSKIEWSKTREWMGLVAQSGTPLFVSAQPEAVGKEQKDIIKDCFAFASRQLPVGEPVDWMENLTPSKWKLNGTIEEFDWS